MIDALDFSLAEGNITIMKGRNIINKFMNPITGLVTHVHFMCITFQALEYIRQLHKGLTNMSLLK